MSFREGIFIDIETTSNGQLPDFDFDEVMNATVENGATAWNKGLLSAIPREQMELIKFFQDKEQTTLKKPYN